jgi:hypothetical protein
MCGDCQVPQRCSAKRYSFLAPEIPGKRPLLAGDDGAIDYSFLVQGFDLLNQRVDFVRCEFRLVLGHVTFAVSDDVAQLVGGSSCDFLRDERRPAEVAPLGHFAMTLRAVIHEDRIRGQRRIRRLTLADSVKHEEHKTHADCRMKRLQVKPHRDQYTVKVWMRSKGAEVSWPELATNRKMACDGLSKSASRD